LGQFGERLRREREMRGITLEEIAEATKIGSRSLRALETEDFAKLPGGIFNKGFVRSYARYLGIDTEQAVTDFLAAEATYYQNTPNAAGNTSSEVSAPRTSGSWLVIAVAVVIVAAIIFGGWKYWSSRSAARSSPRQTSRGAANAGAKSAGSEGQAGTPARAASADGHPTTTAAGASNNAPPGASLLGPSNETHVGTAALGASNETHVGTAAPAQATRPMWARPPSAVQAGQSPAAPSK
jgi:cytoskeleton protein RodZ